MYTLTADSGSTKTTWLLTHTNHPSVGESASQPSSEEPASQPSSEESAPNTSVGESAIQSQTTLLTTQGINPFHMPASTMRDIITGELITQEAFPVPDAIDEIHFFGAGCTQEKSPLLHDLLQSLFPAATEVEVGSDMLGAAKALFADKPGIACILGTGSNSCLYDGQRIVSNVSPMGYILGDEGSGAVLGKTFLNALYKGAHQDLIPVFEAETGLTLPVIIDKVYRQPMPNRFLASLAPFIKSHITQPWISEMVINSFRLFFQNNVKHYLTASVPVDVPVTYSPSKTRGGQGALTTAPVPVEISFVGSIAYHFHDQLRIAAAAEGLTISKILKEPLSPIR